MTQAEWSSDLVEVSNFSANSQMRIRVFVAQQRIFEKKRWAW